MSLKVLLNKILLIILCLQYSNTILSKGDKRNISFGTDLEEIKYNYVFSKNSDFIFNNSYIDLSKIEYQDKICPVKLVFQPDSNIIAIFDDCIKNYHFSDNLLFCQKYETPLTMIAYTQPELTLPMASGNLSHHRMKYMGNGSYCGKDTMTISGNVEITKEHKTYAILPSLDTIKSVVWITRKNEGIITYKTSIPQKVLFLEETSFVFQEDFNYPIFIDCQKTYTLAGKPLHKSRKMLYIDQNVLANMPNVHVFEGKGFNVIPKTSIISNFDIYSQGKRFNATFSTNEDCNYDVIIANVAGILYHSERGKSSKNISQRITIDMTSFPPGKYVIYLYLNGEKFCKIINI